jgi:photosystem II stability/assembly factor-like uncharacterized protein
MKKSIFLLSVILLYICTVECQWNLQSSPVTVNLHGVYFTSPSNGWAVGQYGTIIHTTNGGINWTVLIPSPASSNVNKVAFIDSLHGYIVGDGNTILTTSDGGASWQYMNDGNYYMTHYYDLILSKSGYKAWFVGGRDFNNLSIIVGMNGKFVSPQVIGFAGRIVGIDFINEMTGWAAGMHGIILKTTNGGTWWNQQASGISMADTGFNGIRFFNSEIGLAVSDHGVIQKSLDGGTSWKNIRRGDEILFRVTLLSDSIAYVVGSNNTILLSTDQGESWQTQSTPLQSSATFQDIFFINRNEGWIVGAGGAILHTTDGGVTAVHQEIHTLPQEFSLKQCYPNPFNPSTTIEYNVPHESYIILKIYDVIGREVQTLFEGTKEAGDYSQVWNTDNIVSGVYFYRLSAKSSQGNYSAERKMILIK